MCACVPKPTTSKLPALYFVCMLLQKFQLISQETTMLKLKWAKAENRKNGYQYWYLF